MIGRISCRYLPWLALLVPPRPVSAQGEPPLTPIAAHARATLVLPGFADFLVADGRTVWVTNEGRIEQLSADHPRPMRAVPIPEPCGAMSVAYGSVWVANCQDGSIYRIDRRSGKVTAIIPTGLADKNGELSLAAGANAIWVLSDSQGVLSRVDVPTNRIVARIAVAPHSYAAVFGFGAVWVTNTGARHAVGAGGVQRIDPASNRVSATVAVGPQPRFLAAGEGGVWTLNQGDGSVTRIDPATNTVTATIAVGVAGGGGDIATGGGRVWVRATKILLTAIDPGKNRILERFGPPAGSGAVRVASGHVWVTAHDIHTVWVLQR